MWSDGKLDAISEVEEGGEHLTPRTGLHGPEPRAFGESYLLDKEICMTYYFYNFLKISKSSASVQDLLKAK